MDEPIWTAIIDGDVRTKKNSPRIAGGKEKCPHCGKPRKQWIVPSKAHDLWYRASCRALADILPAETITGPIRIVYAVYTETHRKVDDLNLFAAVDDLLVACKVIEDDNSSIIRSRDGSRVFYDHDWPRVEIKIYKEECA